jgi:hypothetical protein
MKQLIWTNLKTIMLVGILVGISACQLPVLPGQLASADQNNPSTESIPTLEITTPQPSISTANSPTHTSQPSSTNTTAPTATITPTPTPGIGDPFIIGYSVEDRPLEIVRFGNGPEVRLIVAGIHGGYEWNTITLAIELIEYLRTHPDFVPEHITLYILPALNPDGEARIHGPEGRNNSNGVDLNRNWDDHWMKEWPRSGCSYDPATGGPYPHSEPETAALLDFIRDIQPTALISYHSAGGSIFAGGQPVDPASEILAKTLSRASGYVYPPPYSGCLFTGQLIDWASSNGIPAVDVELSNHRYPDTQINLKLLQAFLNWQP